MFLQSSRLTRTARIALCIALLVILVMLTACGTGSHAAGRSPIATATSPQSTPTATPVPQPSLAFNSAAAADLDGLHIQTDGIDCSAWFVLDTPQGTFDAGTLQAMQTYANAFTGYVLTNAVAAVGNKPLTPFTQQLAAQLPSVPNGTHVVPGAGGYGPFFGGSPCTGQLAITNTGTADIQIMGAEATLTAAAVPNTATYNLVDVCSMVPESQCPGNFGGVPPCAYSAEFNLNGGQSGAQASGAVTGGQSPDGSVCPVPITLAPTKAVELTVNFNSASNSLYTVALSLLVNTGAGTTAIHLPAQFDTSLAFAGLGQFTCYGLSTNTFVPETDDPTHGFISVKGANSSSVCL